MLLIEAIQIGKTISKLSSAEISPVLNLGSSTRVFREQEQPYIYENIFSPLEQRGIRVVHVDLKKADGVDIAGDIYDPKMQQQIKELQPKLLLCCNMLEHVRYPEGLARICEETVAPGGYLIVTAPRSFPYHPDPIDTMYRPAPQELASLFPSCSLVDSGIIVGDTYLDELRDKYDREQMRKFARKSMKRFFYPHRDIRSWVVRYYWFTWLWRPYKISWCILRKAD